MATREDTRPAPRHTAAAPSPYARGSIGDRVAEDLGHLARAGANWAGHQAWDLTTAAVTGAVRHPVEFAPAAVAAGVFTGGALAAADPAVGWPLVVVAVGVAGYLLHHRLRDGAAGLMRRAYYALAYAASLVWLGTAAATAPTGSAAGHLLGYGAAAASATWWARHLRRTRGRAPAPEAVGDEDADLAKLRAEIRDWWLECGAAQGGFAQNSTLIDDIEVDDIAARLRVQLDGRKQSFDDLTFATTHKRMAATRGLPRQRIHIGRWEDQREDRAVVTVFRKYLVQENVPFPGPGIDPATGCATVGRCADGTPALVRFWEPGSGTWHEVVCGGSGAGKSRYIDQALINERHALDEQGRHLVVSWICDPQEGQSLPDWQDQVDEYAHNLAESLKLVERAHAEMLARNRMLADVTWHDAKGRERHGVDHFDPVRLAKLGIHLPMLSLTLEEAPTLLAHARIKKLVEEMLKQGRKCGIRLRIVTQVPSIAELGNSFVIRPLLAFMSVVCLRTTEAITSSSFPNLPGDPRQLEERFPNGERSYGLGYVLGAVKPSLFRTFHLDDMVVYDWATEGDTAHLQSLATEQDAAETRNVADTPDTEAPADAAPDGPQGPETQVVGSARERILAYVTDRGDWTTPGVLVTALGLNNSTVSEALKRAVRNGELVRESGMYAPPGTDRGLWQGDERHAA